MVAVTKRKKSREVPSFIKDRVAARPAGSSPDRQPLRSYREEKRSISLPFLFWETATSTVCSQTSMSPSRSISNSFFRRRDRGEVKRRNAQP